GASAKALFDEGKRILYSLTTPTGIHYRSPSTAEAAFPYFEAALRKDPNYAETWLELGNCYLGNGKLLEATERYIQAIRVNPLLAEAHNALGLVYKTHANSLLESDPLGSEAIPFYEKAANSFQQLTILRPDDALAYIYWGETLSRSLQHAKAEKAFSK